MYNVVDWEKDTAGKWRIRVNIKGSTITFKYENWPDDELVQNEAARYDAMMQERIDAIADQNTDTNA